MYTIQLKIDVDMKQEKGELVKGWIKGMHDETFIYPGLPQSLTQVPNPAWKVVRVACRCALTL